jgi:histidinol-phosphatase (PHP family)
MTKSTNILSRIPDYHIHTAFSCDSGSTMAKVCEAAIARGLHEIGFTDHVDHGPDDPPDYFRPVEYLAEIVRCRARYGDRLTIRTGVEIGEPHIFVEETQTLLAMGEFDYVIGSAHYADRMQCGWKAEFFEQPLRQAYEAYFQQVAKLAAAGDFDILGHIDLVKRDAAKFGKAYDGPEPYADIIRSALRSVIERGKGIEINTSPLYKERGMGEPCPTLDILRWYRELGGEILTFGSDAHSPDKLGAHFETALEMARAAGFTRLARFERRQISWIEIGQL